MKKMSLSITNKGKQRIAYWKIKLYLPVDL